MAGPSDLKCEITFEQRIVNTAEENQDVPPGPGTCIPIGNFQGPPWS